ncbi:hypothetical protein D9M72_315090 [compost metagenome]
MHVDPVGQRQRDFLVVGQRPLGDGLHSAVEVMSVEVHVGLHRQRHPGIDNTLVLLLLGLTLLPDDVPEQRPVQRRPLLDELGQAELLHVEGVNVVMPVDWQHVKDRERAPLQRRCIACVDQAAHGHAGALPQPLVAL